MSTPLEPFYQLKCSCNSYPWGKTGSSSLAARLCAQPPPGYLSPDVVSKPFTIDESKPYAEMWMGTYPTLPSYVSSTGEDLQVVLDRHPANLLGSTVTFKFGHTKLPFLPKVLSIAKALPLQVHPNKSFSSKMHAKNPSAFTDPNHKPEIALALTDFEAFVGFKPLSAIVQVLHLNDTLQNLLPQAGVKENETFTNDHLRTVVRTILQADDSTVQKLYSSLTSIPKSAFSSSGPNAAIPDLAPRLADQFDPTDPGILVALLTMNYLTLKPGEAIYIPADGIHAYLSGDIIECMARSDNVLNTGFCPRADRDNVDDFCNVLTFSPHDAGECMLRAKKYSRSEQGKTVVFEPPLSEFNVLETRLAPGEEETLGKVGAAIVLATEGSAVVKTDAKSFELSRGNVYFIAQGQKLEIKAKGDGLIMHTAYVEQGSETH